MYLSSISCAPIKYKYRTSSYVKTDYDTISSRDSTPFQFIAIVKGLIYQIKMLTFSLRIAFLSFSFIINLKSIKKNAPRLEIKQRSSGQLIASKLGVLYLIKGIILYIFMAISALVIVVEEISCTPS